MYEVFYYSIYSKVILLYYKIAYKVKTIANSKDNKYRF
jgi:hypothetical protein